MMRPSLVGPFLAMAASFLLAESSPAQVAPAFRNTIDTVPGGWTGPAFELSKDYPAVAPSDPKHWKAFDFKTQPKEYLQAVLAYALEGNEAVQWKVQDNAVRKWYHAPGLLATGSATNPAAGREFIHGLTRERTSPKQELHPNQTTRLSNWAVGFFNATAAVTIGKVWANPTAPNTTAVKFDDGTVAFKAVVHQRHREPGPLPRQQHEVASEHRSRRSCSRLDRASAARRAFAPGGRRCAR